MLRTLSRKVLKRVRADLNSLVHPILIEHPILVGSHHKCGSSWMYDVFCQISRNCGLRLLYEDCSARPSGTEIHFHAHSQFKLPLLNQIPYRGLHLIRDPRDIIVSGCFYHQRCREPWVHAPQVAFGGMSYQEKLRSFKTLDDQLLFEMENCSAETITELMNWDYDDPYFMNVKYEDLIDDHPLVMFHQIFMFLGFPGHALPGLLQIAFEHSIFSGKLTARAHIRSGQARQWEKYFKPLHHRRFEQLYGDALCHLGYEEQVNTYAIHGLRDGRNTFAG